LRAAHAADIVVFDPARVQSRSTYETPEVSPLGVVTVSKDGKVVKADNLN
jgi:N-acyl-D-aspartate/D-glutamate deacylase